MDVNEGSSLFQSKGHSLECNDLTVSVGEQIETVSVRNAQNET